MLKQLAPQVRQPKQQQQQRGDTMWPQLTSSANSAPLQSQSGWEPRKDTDVGKEPSQETMRQDWNQTNARKASHQKKEWNKAVKQRDSGGLPAWKRDSQGGNAQGSNVQSGFAPRPMAGNVRAVFSPPGLDLPGRPYFPPHNYGASSHQLEVPGMGMWNVPPVHPNHSNMAGYRMGVSAGSHSRSNPYEMGGFAPQKWTGYEGMEYFPRQERPHPLFHPQNAPPMAEQRLMTRPPLHPGYVVPTMPGMAAFHSMVDSQQAQRSKFSDADPQMLSKEQLAERQYGHLTFPASRSHSAGVMPQSYSSAPQSASGTISRSHSSSPALQMQTMPHSHSSGVLPHSHSASALAHSVDVKSHSQAEDGVMGRRLILLRGLPGSGKTTLAKCVLRIIRIDCCIASGHLDRIWAAPISPPPLPSPPPPPSFT